MLGTDAGKEDVTGRQRDHILGVVVAVVHIDDAIENREDFLAIIDMPLIGLIGPMQSHDDPGHTRNAERAPRLIRRELTRSKGITATHHTGGGRTQRSRHPTLRMAGR